MDGKRVATVERKTRETDISITLEVDGSGSGSIDTGIPFFDHMLTLFARHGLIDLEVRAKGDVEVDYHHTVEDVGIVLGEAFKRALGDKKGIRRYGFFLLPMDECLARVAIDLSNRPYLAYRVPVAPGYVRDFNVALVREFFQAFANTLGANLHASLEYGDEPHHIAEALFKALARALDAACRPEPRSAGQVPSTKGVLS
jgi:imidazoleglycerol-phosphate dehydratase